MIRACFNTCIANAKCVDWTYCTARVYIPQTRAAKTFVGTFAINQIVGPAILRAVVSNSISTVAVTGARNAHRVVVVVVPAVLARAVGYPEGGVGGAHARVGAVVRRVVEAPVAGLAAGTGKTGFVGAEDAVVAVPTLTVENVRGERAMGQAGLGA